MPGQELIIPTEHELPGGERPVFGTPVLPSIEGGFELPEGEYSRQDLEDIALMTRLVFAEARGEPFEGQVAVAAVLLNRLEHPDFPDTVQGVIYQPRQFEPVANGTINQIPNNSAYLAVMQAREGADPTQGSVFFWNPRKVSASSWVWTQPVKLQIGDQVLLKSSPSGAAWLYPAILRRLLPISCKCCNGALRRLQPVRRALPPLLGTDGLSERNALDS